MYSQWEYILSTYKELVYFLKTAVVIYIFFFKFPHFSLTFSSPLQIFPTNLVIPWRFIHLEKIISWMYFHGHGNPQLLKPT